MPESIYKLCVYVPEEHAERVKEALFNAGAGRIGNYDRCCWQITGTGQFRPLPGSNAFIGDVGHTETVVELKIELVCAGECLEAALAALLAAHPYETPAFEYWPVNYALPPTGLTPGS